MAVSSQVDRTRWRGKYDPDRMWPRNWVVLEAICLHAPVRAAELDALSGYYAWGILCVLKRLGLIENQFRGRWTATEKGKIALALQRGKEARKRARLNQEIDAWHKTLLAERSTPPCL